MVNQMAIEKCFECPKCGSREFSSNPIIEGDFRGPRIYRCSTCRWTGDKDAAFTAYDEETLKEVIQGIVTAYDDCDSSLFPDDVSWKCLFERIAEAREVVNQEEPKQ